MEVEAVEMETENEAPAPLPHPIQRTYTDGLPRRTVELERGYIDPETGEAFKTVTLRGPLIEDEIQRDALVFNLARTEGLGIARSEAIQVLGLVFQCVDSWEGIEAVQLEHLRALTRSDTNLLLDAFRALELGAAVELLGQAEPDAEFEPRDPRDAP